MIQQGLSIQVKPLADEPGQYLIMLTSEGWDGSQRALKSSMLIAPLNIEGGEPQLGGLSLWVDQVVAGVSESLARFLPLFDVESHSAANYEEQQAEDKAMHRS